MHTRRIATFLLGAWIAGCLFMAFISVQNVRTPTLVMTSPPPAVATQIQQLGWEPMAALLRHAAAEQTRRYTTLWVEAQVLIALVLLGCLTKATQKRIMQLALCANMLVMVLFQLREGPELTNHGRQTDFPPGSLAVGPMTRFWALEQVYFGVEIVKLLCGAILAGYLFVFRTSRRAKDALAMETEIPRIRREL